MNGFIAPAETDTGGFPMYSAYLSICWNLFGKSLLVSHLVLLPFVLGLVYEYFKLARKYLNEKMQVFAMILLMIEPVLVTQSILMGYDVLMVWLFLMSLNLLLSNKHTLFSIALIFLCMSSIRGILLGSALFILDLFLNKKISVFGFSKYIPAFLALLLWGYYHYHKTGWFIFSPEREDNAESTLSISNAIRQAGYILWKINDLGRVFLWSFLFPAGYYFYKKNHSKTIRELFKIVFVPLLTLSIFMSFLANPIGPKYFIAVFLCLQIAICFLLQQFSSNLKRNILFAAICLGLVTGNFWLYPERYGNAWDSSLKVIPYFKLKDRMDEFVRQNKIDLKTIGTQFPLIADKQFSDLSDTSFQYTNVWLGPVENYEYYLQSNVINTDIPEQIERVKKRWTLIRTEECGQVYLSLYRNNHPLKEKFAR